jgi:hypothetical protein
VLALAAGTTLSFIGLPSVDASPRTWDNTFTDDGWNDGSHWQGGTVPQNGDDVLITSNDGIDRTVHYVNPSGVTLNSLTIECTGTGVTTLAQSAHTLATNTLNLGIVGQGAYALSGGSLATGQSFLGINGVGTFTQSGGVHNASQFVSLGDGSLGFGSYVLGDGSFTTPELDIGYSGTGTFGQGGGAVNVSGFVALGTQQGGRGTYNMLASGSMIADNEYVGLFGAGTFVQTAGVNVASTVFSIGENIGAIGTYTMGGSGILQAPELDVAFEGQGAMFQNGGSVSSPNINIGAHGTAVGSFNLTAGTVTAVGAAGDPGDIIVGINSGSSGAFNQIGGSVTSSADISLAYFSNSRGTWTLDGGSIQANRMQIGGNSGASGGLGTFTQNAGTLNATGTVRVWNRGIYRMNGGRFTAERVDVVGGKFIAGAGTGAVPRMRELKLFSSGRVDLNDNKMIVDYNGSSPIGAVGTPDTITDYIANGRNNGVSGVWSGAGVTSSVANGSLFSLGVAEASQVFGISGAQTATFGGQTVDATSVLVKFTYYGDTDLNGLVNFDDYARIDNSFNTGALGWYNGDFNYDGVINFDDYSLIDFAYNTQSVTLNQALKIIDGQDAGVHGDALDRVREHLAEFGQDYANAFASHVPEPTSLSLIGLAVAGTARRRRR